MKLLSSYDSILMLAYISFYFYISNASIGLESRREKERISGSPLRLQTRYALLLPAYSSFFNPSGSLFPY